MLVEVPLYALDQHCIAQLYKCIDQLCLQHIPLRIGCCLNCQWY